MINILITGSNGQLGSELKSISNDLLGYNFFFTTKKNLDIVKKSEIESFVVNKKVDLIINCAAYNNVNKAEIDNQTAREVNELGVKNIGEICKTYKISLIHISTDYVFDGIQKKSYEESDKPNPLNFYGFTKLMGENELIKINPENSIIIRTSNLYSSYGDNFVKKIISKGLINENIIIKSNQESSPTYAHDLAQAIFKLMTNIKNKGIQIYHYSNTGKCSRYELTKYILNLISSRSKLILNIDQNPEVIRPVFSSLNCSKIADYYNLKLIKWEKSLEKNIKKILRKIDI